MPSTATDFKEVQYVPRGASHRHHAPVRIQEIEQGLISDMLDIGAEGLLVPQVTTVEEVVQGGALCEISTLGVAAWVVKGPPTGA